MSEFDYSVIKPSENNIAVYEKEPSNNLSSKVVYCTTSIKNDIDLDSIGEPTTEDVSDYEPYECNDTDDEYVPSEVSSTEDLPPASFKNNKQLDLPITEETRTERIDRILNANMENISSKQYIKNKSLLVNSFEDDSPKVKTVPASSSLGTHTKVFFCIFCKQRVRRFGRHILAMHKTESKVLDILRYPAKHPGRQRLITKLRNESSFLYNNSTFNKGDMIVTRRPNVNKKRYMKDYSPCPYCNGYFISKNLYKHIKNCSPAAKRTFKTSIKNEATALQLELNYKHLDLHANVSDLLKDLKNDSISNTIKNDHLLLRHASYLHNKYRSESHLKYHTRQKLRQLARLLMTVKEAFPEIIDLEDCIQPKNFMKVLKGVQILCKLKDTGEFEIPSLAAHLGIYLKETACVLHTTYIIAQNEEKKKMVTDFKDLLEYEYNAEISRTARKTIEELKWNKEKLLPLTKDIQIFRDFLTLKAEEACKSLTQNGYCYSKWRLLVELTAALILTFNRKRPGETERIWLKSYYSKQTIKKESEEYKTLSTLEQLLCDSLRRIEIRGKRGRRVPILLRENHMYFIEKFLYYRQQAGVSNQNIYLFGISENNYIHITDIIRRESLLCGAEQPHLLRATHLRKQVATTAQVLDMNDNEMQLLADFMGHDIDIHKSHYRTPELTLQIAKLSKLLIAVDNGDIKEYKGKNLQNIDISKYLEVNKDTEVEYNINEDTANNSKTVYSSSSETIKSASTSKRNEIIPSNNKIKRVPWKVTEIKAIQELFPQHLKNKTLPKETKILEILKYDMRLANRTPAQIKAYVNNINRKNM